MSDHPARERILARVRSALAGRTAEDGPGPFEGWRPSGDGGREGDDGVGAFVRMFEGAGGEVVRVRGVGAAAGWLSRAAGGGTVAVGATVPVEVTEGLSPARPEVADVGVSMACGAIAETGSLMLDARDGRRTQLLPPTHVVLVRERDVHARLADALEAISSDLPSAMGLHSGPSKSADIGQVMVKGVHGPGRLIALLIEEEG